jgi:hypothetical protein
MNNNTLPSNKTKSSICKRMYKTPYTNIRKAAMVADKEVLLKIAREQAVISIKIPAEAIRQAISKTICSSRESSKR